MSGPFVDTPLTTGNYFTQTRQRQMNTNSKLNWERTAYREIQLGNFADSRTESTNPSGTVTTRIKVNGATAATSTTSGDIKFSNLDLSALAVGLHTLTVEVSVSSIGGFAISCMARFWRSDYMNNLTLWATVGQDTTAVDAAYVQEVFANNVSAIIHEQDETW